MIEGNFVTVANYVKFKKLKIFRVGMHGKEYKNTDCWLWLVVHNLWLELKLLFAQKQKIFELPPKIMRPVVPHVLLRV